MCSIRSSGSAELLLREIEERLDGLDELDPTVLTPGEVTDLVVRTQRLRTRLDAQCARVAGALDVSKAWVDDGARSPSAWISWRCSVSMERARASLKTARALRAMPRTEGAFVAGTLTADHVRLLAYAQATNAEEFERDGEERLIGLAGELLFSQFERAVTYWCHLADPDDAEAKARKRREGRRVHASRTFEGHVVLDALLDPMTGAIVLRELERLERELFDEDLAEARERVGSNAALSDLRRTPSQRRADALRVMAERSAAKPANAVEGRILAQVLAGHETVDRMCELSGGTVITPGEVLPVLARADVERVIFDGPSKVIDVGVRRRLFTDATRTAVQARDRQCVHPSCDVPAERCEVDHIQPWAAGGLTMQDNGRCLCKYHHRRAPRSSRAP